MENGYVECATCKKRYAQGTIGRDHVGYGKRTVVPQRRWHGASEVRTVRYARSEWLCATCGGERIERDTQAPLWKRARAAWAEVDGTSELGAMRGRR